MKNFIFCAMARVGVLNWVSKFHVSTDSEHKFHKTEIEIGYPLDPVWDRLDYEPLSQNDQTMFKNLKGFICPSIKSWNNAGDILLP